MVPTWAWIATIAFIGALLAFDTGPANVLMDGWCTEKTGRPYDDKGRWAASGQVLEALLAVMLQEPYLQLPHPKSTGRELFHREWLQGCLARSGQQQPADADVMRTLLQFTVRTVADAVGRGGVAGGELFVCGGAAMNDFFMQCLADALDGTALDLPTHDDRADDPDAGLACPDGFGHQRGVADRPRRGRAPPPDQPAGDQRHGG